MARPLQPRPAPGRPSARRQQGGQDWTPIGGQFCAPIDRIHDNNHFQGVYSCQHPHSAPITSAASCVDADPADVRPPEYMDPDLLFTDIARTYKQAVAAYYAAGCRYLQLDDIFFAYLGDPKQREQRRAMGQDPDWLIDRYAWMLEEAIKDRPENMVIGMHMCRGNFRSTHAASGGYDAAADAIFNTTSVDVYFMEYDTDRAGGLEPLKLLPKGRKRIMAGFITTKTGGVGKSGFTAPALQRCVKICRYGSARQRPAMRFRVSAHFHAR
ncbi:hypothetical protein [Rhizobium sp. G21]|uniref:hypothetical protein n=1 Tax=Rhizobium sp. G21 TaxID=2758439 RepID=UPI001FF0701B|nr:hypothetical protein [Rhizobium sp. G21]